MKGTINPSEKYESTSENAGRSQREKHRARNSAKALSATHGHHTTSEMSTTKSTTLSTPPTYYEWKSHPAIDRELERYIKSDRELRQTVIDSIRTLTHEVPHAKISAFLEHDPEEPETTRPVIEVRDDFDEVDQYRSLKTKVQEIVRDAERGDAMVYTRISRA